MVIGEEAAVSDFPFGFTPGGSGDPDDPSPAGMPAGFDAASLGAMFEQLGRAMQQGGDDAVNWSMAGDAAREALGGSDPAVSDADRAAVLDAARLGESWLDGATTLPTGTTDAAAWTRQQWIEHTLPRWAPVVDPVADKVSAATDKAVPEEMRAMVGPMLGMVRQLGSAMFGSQVGQGIGRLATEVVSGYDIGLPLVEPGTAVLLPANVAAFGAGLGQPADDVRLFLVLRELAHHRLFAHAPWLEATLLSAVAEYAGGVDIDLGRMQELMAGVDPQNPEAVQQAIESGMFETERSPAQQAAAVRLETLLALVEGWVDVVVAQAAAPIAGAPALREAVRRRRAAGGPAEQTFATLVGIELRPRRLREAAALWEAVEVARGTEGRDALWAHPDLLPASSDLDDPEAFARGGDEPFDLSGLEE